MRTTPALAVLISLLIASAAPAGTILVDLNGGGDYLTIRWAVHAAVVPGWVGIGDEDEESVAVASGVYFVRAEIGSWSGTRKLAVVR